MEFEIDSEGAIKPFPKTDMKFMQYEKGDLGIEIRQVSHEKGPKWAGLENVKLWGKRGEVGGEGEQEPKV